MDNFFASARSLWFLTTETLWVYVFAGVFLMSVFVFLNMLYIYKKNFARIKIKLLATAFVQAALIVLLVWHFAKLFEGKSYGSMLNAFSFFAGFYLVFIFYFSLLSIFMYAIIFIAKHGFGKKLKVIGLVVIGLSVAISLASFFPPKVFAVKDYEITMDKKESKLSSLSIVYVSDIHVGCSVKKAQLKTIRDKVNELRPDIFLLDGDVFDEGSSEYYKRQTVSILSGVKAKYGSYYVEGNHDDYGKRLRRNAPDAFTYFEGSNIEPLRDEMKLLADSFYVIGRLDKNAIQRSRRKLEGFEAEMKRDLPVFVFDHRARTEETRGRELLQLSGHTHNGQIFPASALDPFRRVNIYGAYERDKMQLIISSGVGTYGVPNRLGNFSEIVNVKITLA